MPSASFTSSRSYVRRSRRKGNRIALPGVGRSRATGKNLKFVAACMDLLFLRSSQRWFSFVVVPGQFNVQKQQQAQSGQAACNVCLFALWKSHSFIQSKVAKFVQINCMLARYTLLRHTHERAFVEYTRWGWSGESCGSPRKAWIRTHTHGVRIIICNNKIKVRVAYWRINWMVAYPRRLLYPRRGHRL